MSFESFHQAEKPGTKENPKEKLESLMRRLSRETNAELGEDLLDERGNLVMAKFHTNQAGPFDQAVRDHDDQHIANKKLEFSGAYNLPAGLERERRINDWEVSKHKSKSELLEMAVTSIFYKVLHEKFIVMRSATFDDYENGIDNVIVNKETGDIICAFDEVHDKNDGDRLKKKNDRIIAKAKSGGAKLKYGISFDKDHRLIKTSLKNIPVFYLAMDSEELDRLLADFSADNQELSAHESKAFGAFVDSLNYQRELILQQEALPEAIKLNLEKFSHSLAQMQNYQQKL